MKTFAKVATVTFMATSFAVPAIADDNEGGFWKTLLNGMQQDGSDSNSNSNSSSNSSSNSESEGDDGDGDGDDD